MPVLSLSGPNAAGSAAYRFSVPGQLAQLARDSWLGATAGAADRLPYLGVVLRDQWPSPPPSRRSAMAARLTSQPVREFVSFRPAPIRLCRPTWFPGQGTSRTGRWPVTDIWYPDTAIDGVPVVAAPAEIDITNADGLRSALLRAAAAGSGTLVVDMAQTQFCDSSGLHPLGRGGSPRRWPGPYMSTGTETRRFAPRTPSSGGRSRNAATTESRNRHLSPGRASLAWLMAQPGDGRGCGSPAHSRSVVAGQRSALRRF
jgi:hypothetical protein